jgi:hypothetical protein
LGTSASGIGATAPPRSITWIQSGAVRLVDQAARLQISDTIAPTSGAVVPEIATLSGLREQAERLRTAIQDQADRVRDDADPTRDAATVSAFVDVLEPNVAKLRDVTRQADQQIDKRRATYLSSASLLQSTALTNTKSWLRCLRRSSPEPSSQPPRPPSAALACVRGAKCASTPAFHDAEAADGWEDLCKQARGAPRTAWEALTRAPRDRSNPARQAQLRLDLATRTVGGRQFEQWQYEITAGGRTWYCPNPDKMIVLVMYAGVGHPRATDT